MYRILIGLGVLCLLYLAVLLAKQVDFAMIWLAIGGVFLAAGAYLRHCALHPQGARLPAPALAAAGILAAACLALFVVVEGLILAEMRKEPQPAEALIVLGAQVRGDKPSRALLRRLETAQRYLEEYPSARAILSGGQGDGEDITEAECMYEYLTEHGIAKERLILEDASTTTKENLYFSAQKLDGLMQKKTALLSNNFHVFRARLLAQKMGYTDVSGVAAPSDWRLQIHYLVREFFAVIKEKLQGNI